MRCNFTSSVSDGQVVSSLQLDLQLVHPRAVDGSVSRDPRGTWSTHSLSGETVHSLQSALLGITTKAVLLN